MCIVKMEYVSSICCRAAEKNTIMTKTIIVLPTYCKLESAIVSANYISEDRGIKT